jgi:hypothetical protein
MLLTHGITLESTGGEPNRQRRMGEGIQISGLAAWQQWIAAAADSQGQGSSAVGAAAATTPQVARLRAAGLAATLRDGVLRAEVSEAVTGESSSKAVLPQQGPGIQEEGQHQSMQQRATVAAPAGAAGAPAKPARGMLGALGGCWDFKCLRWAHGLPRQGAGAFNFPHFMLVGWQKAATTSLYW